MAVAAAVKSALAFSIPRPPDGGRYGNACIAATFCVYAVVIGLEACFGVLLPDMLGDATLKGASFASLAWVSSISIFLELALGVPVGSLIDRFGVRVVCCIGGLLIGLGCLLSASATSVEVLYVTYSITVGMGLAFAYGASSIGIGMFFTANAAYANQVAGIGAGVGTIALAVAIQLLVAALDWRVCLRVLGPLFAVLICVSSLAYVPIDDLSGAAAAPGEGATALDVCHEAAVGGEREEWGEPLRRGPDASPAQDTTDSSASAELFAPAHQPATTDDVRLVPSQPPPRKTALQLLAAENTRALPPMTPALRPLSTPALRASKGPAPLAPRVESGGSFVASRDHIAEETVRGGRTFFATKEGQDRISSQRGGTPPSHGGSGGARSATNTPLSPFVMAGAHASAASIVPQLSLNPAALRELVRKDNQRARERRALSIADWPTALSGAPAVIDVAEVESQSEAGAPAMDASSGVATDREEKPVEASPPPASGLAALLHSFGLLPSSSAHEQSTALVVWTDYRFWSFAATMALSVASMCVSEVYLGAFAQEEGHFPPDLVASLYSMMGAAGIVGRLVLGVATLYWDMDLLFLVQVCGVITGLAMAFLSVYGSSYAYLALFAFTQGAIGSVMFSCSTPLLAALFGIPALPYALGGTYTLRAPLVLLAAPMAGYLQRAQGNFRDVWAISGIVLILSALPVGLMGCQCTRRRKA